MIDDSPLALVLKSDALIGSIEPTRILARYRDLLLVRVPTPTHPLTRSALELIPADLPVRVNGLEVAVPAGGFAPVATPRAVLRFFGPIAADWPARLTAFGVSVHFRCPRFGLCAELPADLDVAALRAALPALAGWVPYDFRLCRRAQPRAAAALPDWTDLVCFTEADREQVTAALAAMATPVLARSRYKLRIASGQPLAELRRLRGVKLADRARTPILAGTELASAVGLPDASFADIPDGLDGAGEIVAVADTGLDRGDPTGAMHPDFDGRVRALLSWPLNPSWDDHVLNPGADDGGADLASGHGTHVAGLIVGDGRRSGGRHRGLASGAQLVFQAIEQYAEVRPEHRTEIPSGWYLSGRPLDLRDLFEQARALGARIHVNAWGDPADGRYTDDCFETDLFCRQHPDALVLFAAGNAGRAGRDGTRLEPASLYAPAAAKNAVAVGATEGPVVGIGYRGTWRGFDPDGRRFPTPALAERPVSGRPERIALFSSTGPTRDGRIKPDLCAPGTNLVGPKSQASTAQGWGLASPLFHYVYYGGTSMACGVAGGCAALLRQAWTRARGAAPSGPALKALLCYGAATVIGPDGLRPAAVHEAGFGRIDLSASLPGGTASPVLLDRALTPAQDGLVTGQIHEIHVELAAGAHFRALLCWYDEPGEVLVNDLDLCLLDPHGNATWGNHPPGESGHPDRANTVERIDIDVAATGTWRLRIIAVNVPRGPQGFALVHSAARTTTPAAPASGADVARPLPTIWLKGIGATYAARLAAAGVTDLAALVAMPPERLAALLDLDAGRRRRLDERLAPLRALPALVAAPSTLTLARLRQGRPENLDEMTWQALGDALAPLSDVFDKAALDQIRIADLRRLSSSSRNTEENDDG